MSRDEIDSNIIGLLNSVKFNIFSFLFYFNLTVIGFILNITWLFFFGFVTTLSAFSHLRGVISTKRMVKQQAELKEIKEEVMKK